jgi:hypothetical protein
MEVIRVAFPFCPMTNEILKKLSRVIQDSDQTIKYPELPCTLASHELNFAFELNPQHSETDQSNLRT